MRVVLDGTPLLGQRTGVGRYTEHLLTGLARLATEPGREAGAGWELAATAFTWRGLDELP